MEWAREVLARAQTVEQLRQAQAVVLPLDHGLSLEQTTRAIGRSVPWTCRLRNRFLAGEIVGDGKPGLNARWRCPRSATCCAGTAGASVHHTSATRKATRWRKRSEKRLPQRLVQLGVHWPDQAPINLMFQDEAGFGRINDMCRCWVPTPVRPLCRAMLTHGYTCACAAVGAHRATRLADPAPCRHALHADVPRRGRAAPPEPAHRDGPGWRRPARKRRTAASRQHALAELAAVSPRTRSGRACPGRIAREAVPQPGRRQP